MAKKVVPLPPCPATPAGTISELQSRVVIRLGKQRYELDITYPATILPPEPEPASGLIKNEVHSTPTAGARIPLLRSKCALPSDQSPVLTIRVEPDQR